VSRSAGDQMLKYGSCATSGTDGGRKSAANVKGASVERRNVARWSEGRMRGGGELRRKAV